MSDEPSWFAAEEGEVSDGPNFLSVEDVLMIHGECIRQFTPTESLTLRDRGLLESAVMNPRQTFGGEYLYPSLAEIATAYLVGLALNHPFENGNKRVALAACSVFLRINGYRLTLSQDKAVALTLNVINRVWTREQALRAIAEGMEEL